MNYFSHSGLNIFHIGNIRAPVEAEISELYGTEDSLAMKPSLNFRKVLKVKGNETYRRTFL